MTATIISVLSLIEALLPAILSANQAALVANVITVLTNLLPYIVQEVEVLYTPVKNIIAALSASPATLVDQLATLQALDAKLDAAFESAATQTDLEAAAVDLAAGKPPA